MHSAAAKASSEATRTMAIRAARAKPSTALASRELSLLASQAKLLQSSPRKLLKTNQALVNIWNSMIQNYVTLKM